MGVTAIKRIDNESRWEIWVNNSESQGDNRRLPPGTFADSDMWIPWCTRQGEFDAHHITVTGGRTWYAIWQSWKHDGDRVRCSVGDKYYEPGDWIEGESEVNGDRRLVLWDDGVWLSRDFPDTNLPGA